MRICPIIELTDEQKHLLEEITRSRQLPHSLVQRAQVVLLANAGKKNKAISQELHFQEETVGKWRKRWLSVSEELAACAGKLKALRQTIESTLADAPRPGAPTIFTAEQICQLIALACETPPEYLSEWSRTTLAQEAVKRKIVESVSPTSIGRFLNQGQIKPHRSRYWLNHEVEDEAQFREEVRAICKVYHQAEELHEQGTHVISVDEKTGIQALERIHPTQPAKPGQVERVEFEYQRHGTQALIANFEVATGQVIFPTIQETRTEADFLKHIQQTVESDPKGKWLFIADQLNTHKSASLVKWIAEECNIKDNLGEKGKTGILRDMASRTEFLQDENHRIRFIYTPKHCSWLNQVEIWFGILSRRLLKRGQFKSTVKLKERILKFIAFFNETLAKPFRWTYIGKPLVV